MAVDIIDRSKLSGLIPEPVTREIIQGAVTESAVLRMARRLPNMTSKTQTLNVLDALPTAYFVKDVYKRQVHGGAGRDQRKGRAKGHPDR